jgi:HSP90 family molecular chaperone
MDDAKELLPQYLRFVRGIIDSEDLPLNVSREILQQNKVLTSIKTSSVKKILSELKSIANSDPEKYSQFIAEYNRPLKEGVHASYCANHCARSARLHSDCHRAQQYAVHSLPQRRPRRFLPARHR